MSSTEDSHDDRGTSSNHDAVIDESVEEVMEVVVEGGGVDDDEDDDDGDGDDHDDHDDHDASQNNTTTSSMMSRSARMYANRAALLEGVLATKVRQLRTVTNRARLMEDALRKRRGNRGGAGVATSMMTTTTTTTISRHIGEMSTREVGEEDKDREKYGEEYERDVESSSGWEERRSSSFSIAPSSDDDMTKEGRDGIGMETVIVEKERENKALQEEVLRLQNEVWRLRTQLADLLDAHDDLERRVNDDVLEAEAVVVSKYEKMLREMESHYDARLAVEMSEKEGYRQRWMEEVDRHRQPGMGGKADEGDGMERRPRDRTTTTSMEDVAVSEPDARDGRNNAAPSLAMTSVDDSSDASDHDNAADDNAAEIAIRDEERGRDNGDLIEVVTSDLHDVDVERASRAQTITSIEVTTAREELTERSSHEKSGGRPLGASTSAGPSSLDDVAIVVATRTEEDVPIDSDGSADDDDVSRGGLVEIATASLTRAIDRIRELEIQLRRQEESHESSTERILEQQQKLREYLSAQLETYYETIQHQSALINDQTERMTEAERRHEEGMVIATSSVEASRRREGALLTNIEELEGELNMARREVGEREGVLVRMRSHLVELEGKIQDRNARERTLVELNEELTTKVKVLEWRVQEATRELDSKEDETRSQVMEESGGDEASSRTKIDRDKARHVVPSHDTLPNNYGNSVPKPRRRRWVRAILRPWTLFSGR